MVGQQPVDCSLDAKASIDQHQRGPLEVGNRRRSIHEDIRYSEHPIDFFPEQCSLLDEAMNLPWCERQRLADVWNSQPGGVGSNAHNL